MKNEIKLYKYESLQKDRMLSEINQRIHETRINKTELRQETLNMDKQIKDIFEEIYIKIKGFEQQKLDSLKNMVKNKMNILKKQEKNLKHFAKKIKEIGIDNEIKNEFNELNNQELVNIKLFIHSNIQNIINAFSNIIIDDNKINYTNNLINESEIEELKSELNQKNKLIDELNIKINNNSKLKQQTIKLKV